MGCVGSCQCPGEPITLPRGAIGGVATVAEVILLRVGTDGNIASVVTAAWRYSVTEQSVTPGLSTLTGKK